MNARLIDLLLRLSPRERGLLAFAALVVLPLVIVLGILLPLSEKREAAQRDRADAQALQIWVQDRVAEQRQYAAAPAASPATPIGSSGIERGLIEAKLRRAVSELGTRTDGVVELRFDQVDFARLATWMSAAHPDWGYDIESFRFEAGEEPGKVSAWLVLTPRQG